MKGKRTIMAVLSTVLAAGGLLALIMPRRLVPCTSSFSIGRARTSGASTSATRGSAPAILSWRATR
jgi:hypothetical protein